MGHLGGWAALLACNKGTEKNRAHTRSPTESSVYNLSMVFDDPPAPAARDELGLAACDAPARRLQNRPISESVDNIATVRTGFEHLVVWRLRPHLLLKMSAMWRSGKVRQSRTGRWNRIG